jgi:hypothetical protein
MPSGSFADLRVLSENLANTGNEAEELRNTPRACLAKLRDWLEHLLEFLEDRHKIPRATPADLKGKGKDGKDKGENEYRIDRLLSHDDVNIGGSEIGLLHKIRQASNKASHIGNESFFTISNVEVNLRRARRIAKWLKRRYVSSPREERVKLARPPQTDMHDGIGEQKPSSNRPQDFTSPPAPQHKISKDPGPQISVPKSVGRPNRQSRAAYFLVGLFDFLIFIVASAVLHVGPVCHQNVSDTWVNHLRECLAHLV